MPGQLSIQQGDITRLEVDAIVNAANELMLGGGGVDGAIHGAAGPRLLEACRAVPEVRPGVRCPTGEARITPGFDLAARYVIHTVGPVWQGGNSGEDQLLAACYRTTLALAESHALQSIAFPAISCGVFGFPVRRASAIAVQEVRRHLESARSVSTVHLVAFDAAMFEVLRVRSMIESVRRWAELRDDILGLAVAGSHARGSATADSDIDLTLVCSDPARYLDDTQWLSTFGEVTSSTREDWGKVQSLRVFYRDRSEVEFGIAGLDWTEIPPDPGTAQVLRAGCVILHDPAGLLDRLLQSALR